jgi:hypothetical protein
MKTKITSIALIAALISPMAATAGGVAGEVLEAPVNVVTDAASVPVTPVVPLIGGLSPVAAGAIALAGLGVLAAVAGGGDSTSDTQ